MEGLDPPRGIKAADLAGEFRPGGYQAYNGWGRRSNGRCVRPTGRAENLLRGNNRNKQECAQMAAWIAQDYYQMPEPLSLAALSGTLSDIQAKELDCCERKYR